MASSSLSPLANMTNKSSLVIRYQPEQSRILLECVLDTTLARPAAWSRESHFTKRNLNRRAIPLKKKGRARSLQFARYLAFSDTLDSLKFTYCLARPDLLESNVKWRERGVRNIRDLRSEWLIMFVEAINWADGERRRGSKKMWDDQGKTKQEGVNLEEPR